MNIDNITDDLLIVDYTEYHQKHSAENLPSHGVMFIETPDSRLGAFCILNPNHYPYKAINLEANPGLVTDENGAAVKQCECICCAHRVEGRRWILLLELKYCEKDNIPDNMQNALEKLEKCYDFLNEKKHYFDGCQYNVYFCASHPEHEVSEPFGSFIYNQDRLLDLKEKKSITLLYCNAVKVLTPEYLLQSKVPHKYQYER